MAVATTTCMVLECRSLELQMASSYSPGNADTGMAAADSCHDLANPGTIHWKHWIPGARADAAEGSKTWL